MAYANNSILDFGAVDSNKHGLTDSYAAIQKALDESEGTLVFPAGRYDISQNLMVTKPIRLQGEGRGATSIFTMGDVNAITFGSGSSYASLRDMFVVGGQDAANATGWVVYVDRGLPIFIRDCNIWGGGWAFVTNGADGTIQDCFITGGQKGGNIYSGGANWYIRVKDDTNSIPVPYGFYQGIGDSPGVMENHLFQCDFSNQWSIAAIEINDPNNLAITTFDSCVIGGVVNVKGALATMFTGNEMGSGYNESLVIDGGGNWCQVPSQWTGPGQRVKGSYNLEGF